MKKIISTSEAPAAVGPYSQAVRVGSMVFCAGQIPLDPKTAQIVSGDIGEQTRRVLDNITAVLKAEGLTFENIVKTTIFLTDLGDFQTVNEIYGSYFKQAPPARSTVQVSGLPKGARVEIEAIAMIDQNLGTVAMIRGDLRGALEAFRLSHLGYQALGMRNHEAQVLNNIALAYMELGELSDAEAAYDEAARVFEEDGDHARQLDLAVNKVQLYIAGRRYDEALAQCHKLLAMRTDESAPWRGEVFRHIGVIARARGDFPEATDNLLKAEQRALESGDLLLRADVSEQLAELYWAQKRHKDMLHRLNEAHSLYTQLKAQHRVAQVEKRNGALEERFLEMAKQWGDSIESKDRYTQGHCERVAFFACVLADSAGFNSRSLFWFRIGALLHDIGKIIVPTEVLNKPGKLTDEEWAIMKRHPEAGLELVADIDFPGDIGAIIRNHHERWDGGGYPDGLKGEEIPFAARILCVADVYDALTTTRSYRPGLTHARAAEIMRASTGQFDPDLLETFLDWAETADIPGRPTPQRMAIFASGTGD